MMYPRLTHRVPTAFLFCLILIIALVPAAAAAKPAPGGSTGTARVFSPNPVASLHDQTLTDQKDADYPALQPAYQLKALTNLDGSGYLRGDWASVVSETGDPAYSPDNNFFYGRSDDRFEQVMAYYWVTEAQKYIQSLGFNGSNRPAINNRPQEIRINQWGQDNSYYWDKHYVLRFGKGGVDDAEDAEVILHEYGHAIQGWQVPGFGSTAESGAIGEGFGDYWAVSVANLVSGNDYDLPCVADWDSVSYTNAPHCLRRLDRNLHYPEDLNGLVHHDGMVWSQALWNIRQALGTTRADTLILQGQFAFPVDASMPVAAQATVAAARTLYGQSVARQVTSAFQDRGILP